MATPAVGCAVSTIFGRNIVVRNSVMAVAWYLVTNQCPPHRLLLSACDFLAVLESRACVPDFWQNVLVTWGMFDPPVPHVEEERSAQDVTPAHCADVLERDHARNSATLTRVSGERRERAAMVLERYLLLHRPNPTRCALCGSGRVAPVWDATLSCACGAAHDARGVLERHVDLVG